MIGQAKPPVASKEEIEKSGLPVFKRSDLTEYQGTGKVASNTVDNVSFIHDVIIPIF